MSKNNHNLLHNMDMEAQAQIEQKIADGRFLPVTSDDIKVGLIVYQKTGVKYISIIVAFPSENLWKQVSPDDPDLTKGDFFVESDPAQRRYSALRESLIDDEESI